MSEMLTAKEMEELLQVDRSTIYRMAESGRLPAIKVGKQWRFPAEKVENWFKLSISSTSPGDGREEQSVQERPAHDLSALLPLECVQLIQDTFADLLGLMLVVTDIDGKPITRPSHTCGLFDVVSEVPHALERCIVSWRDLASTLDLEPRFTHSHLGLLCSRAMIRVGTELKGMVIAGCVAPESWPPSESQLLAIARDVEIEPDILRPQLNQVFHLDKAQKELLLGHLQRIANIIAHIIYERNTLLGRLEAIADLTAL
jgi:excisionase family DNA binding protein